MQVSWKAFLLEAHSEEKHSAALLSTFQCFNNGNILWWNNVTISHTFQHINNSSAVTAHAWEATEDLDEIYSRNSSLFVYHYNSAFTSVHSVATAVPSLLLFLRFVKIIFQFSFIFEITIRHKCLKIEDVLYCTDCKALWGKKHFGSMKKCNLKNAGARTSMITSVCVVDSGQFWQLEINYC